MAETAQLCPNCFAAKSAAAVCPRCGFTAGPNPPALWLPPGTLVHGEYVIGRALGKPGGFGITYLAWERTLELRVAIKEYLPRDLAGRMAGSARVQSHSEDEEVAFRYGLEQFLREARTLAVLDHPNIVRVRRFFEDNGTAYLVMEYWEGSSLAALLGKSGRVPEMEATALLLPILGALEYLHGRNLLHRDIKPANIYLKRDGTPVLLDFGAARWALGERTQSLSVLLSPGYSAFEQYHAQGAQGTWTDVYGVTATLYRMLTGIDPPDATGRIDNDTLVPAEQLVPGLSPQVARALAAGLAPRRTDRAQTVAALRSLLTEKAPAAGPRVAERVSAAEPAAPRAAATPPRPVQATGPHAGAPPSQAPPRPPQPARRATVTASAPDRAIRAKRDRWAVALAVTGAAIAVIWIVLASFGHKEEFVEESPPPVTTDVLTTNASEPTTSEMGSGSTPMGTEMGTGTSSPVSPATRVTKESPQNDKDGLRYAWIPPGEFQMGCVKAPCGYVDELPRHPVRFAHGFWLGTTEVTVAAYRRYSSASGHPMPAKSPDFNQGWSHGDYPIVDVSWNDAQSFCSWSGGRLPSEAEWEYAARERQDGRIYPWGDEGPVHEHNSPHGAGCGQLEPTGSYHVSSLGLYDMVGNSQQWCEDEWNPSHVGAPADGSARSGSDPHAYHVVRGGIWGCRAISQRSLARDTDGDIGFRCARDRAP